MNYNTFTVGYFSFNEFNLPENYSTMKVLETFYQLLNTLYYYNTGFNKKVSICVSEK